MMICALFAARIAIAQTSRAKPPTERTVYSEYSDESFDDFLPLPENLLNVLLATAEAREMSRELQGLDRNELAKLFSAIEVHLDDRGKQDYLVLGKSPMSGADCDWFWIVRSGQTHPKVILFANTNSIELLKSRTNGYRNIRSVWESAAGYTITNVYHYNGARYRLAHHFVTQDKQIP
jgi:hypothetical protein